MISFDRRRRRRRRRLDWDRLEVRSVPTASAAFPALGVPYVPTERLDPHALMRHDQDLALAKRADSPVVLLGDSISDFWISPTKGQPGLASWKSELAPLGAADMGVYGDQTQNVLWRVQNGELAGRPKVVVLEVGTNNLYAGNDIYETYWGIAWDVKAIQAADPGADVILMGVFPRGDDVNDPARAQISALNDALDGLADGLTVQFLRIGSQLVLPDGEVDKTLLGDYLHPPAAGYQVWADNLEPLLVKELAQAPGVTLVSVTPPPGQGTVNADLAYLSPVAANWGGGGATTHYVAAAAAAAEPYLERVAQATTGPVKLADLNFYGTGEG